VGVSELRSGIEKVLKKAHDGLVIIEKRHKPTAVLMSNEEYEHIQNLLETAEDLVLGFIAQARSASDMISAPTRAGSMNRTPTGKLSNSG